MSALRARESSPDLFALVQRRLERSPRLDFLQFLPGPLNLSGPALLAEIRRASDAISRVRLPPGARILVQISHPLALLVTLPALWNLGYVPILSEASASPSDQQSRLEQFSPHAVLQDSQEAPAGSQSIFLPPLPLLRLLPIAARSRLPLPTETVLVRTTSGSAGRPRGVALSARQMLADARNISGTLQLSTSTRSLAAIPLSHAYGFSTLLTPCLFLGIPLVLLEHPFPELLRKALGRHQALFFPGVPLLFDLLLASRVSDNLLSRLSPAVSAGAPLPCETARKFAERTGNPLRNFYGASECGAISCERSPKNGARPGGVGAPLKGVRVALEPTREMSRGAAGRSGRIVVRGSAVALGYVGAGARPRLFRGRFQTCDLGRKDSAGRIFLEGRLDRMINVGGRKVFPEEVERVLGGAPGVREVVVLSIADSLRGELVAAAVVGVHGLREATLLRYCRKHLTAYRVPRRLLLLPALPRTARGKVDTARLHSLLTGR
ncbi:MAG: fatty acid--CoA ligase family protein [Acidobacteria bacterium]|nr:fatty acid--CoA ligase family protein [Acidobacteriota bacterium]MCI0658956.1 fatty acid--CoA ligase family protein [Acidobacteriota bacterium]